VWYPAILGKDDRTYLIVVLAPLLLRALQATKITAIFDALFLTCFASSRSASSSRMSLT
jgi:hypothetical protein